MISVLESVCENLAKPVFLFLAEDVFLIGERCFGQLTLGLLAGHNSGQRKEKKNLHHAHGNKEFLAGGYYGCLKTLPSFMTKFTCFKTSILANGSPETAITSA